MSGIFLSLSRIENELFHRNLFVSNASKHLVGLYTTRLPVFRWKARGYDWILVDSIGQPSEWSQSGRLRELENKGKVQLGNPKSARGGLYTLFITKFKSQFKRGFAKVVAT